MAICSICGGSLKKIDDAEVNVLLGLLEKSKCGSLYKLYPHIFEYCPNCIIGDIELDEDNVELIKSRKDDLAKAFSNKNLEEIDVFKWARIAEIVGFSYEVVGNTREAALAYKASTDILDIMISSFITRHQHMAEEDGEKVGLLKMQDFEICKNALIYSKNLKRLTLGHLLKSIKEDDMVLFLIYFDTVIELDLKDERNKITSVLSKEKHPNKLYQDAIDCLLSKSNSLKA